MARRGRVELEAILKDRLSDQYAQMLARIRGQSSNFDPGLDEAIDQEIQGVSERVSNMSNEVSDSLNDLVPDDAGDGLEDLGDKGEEAADKMSDGFGDVGNILMGAFSAVAVQRAAAVAAELYQIGSQAERSERTMIGMSGSFSMAYENLGRLREITQRTVSDMELMQQASKMVSMGVAGNFQEATRQIEAAVALGAKFGEAPTDAIENWSLMLANTSKKRLDTFGLSIENVDRRMAELAEQFPEMSREARFAQAAMEDANRTVGDSSEVLTDSQGALDKTAAGWRSVREEIGLSLQAAESTSAIGDMVWDIADAMEETRIKTRYFGEEYREFLSMASRGHVDTTAYEQFDERLSQIQLIEGLTQNLSATDPWQEMEWEGKSLDEIRGKLESVAEEIERISTEEYVIEIALSTNLNEDMRGFREEHLDLVGQLEEEKRTLSDLEAQNGRIVQNKKYLIGVERELAQAKRARLVEELNAGGLEEEQALKIQSNLEKIDSALGRPRTFSIDVSDEIDEQQQKIDSLTESINANITAARESMNQQLFGMVQSRIEGSALTEGEKFELTLGLGNAMGQIDNLTLNIGYAIDELIGLSETGEMEIDQVVEAMSSSFDTIAEAEARAIEHGGNIERYLDEADFEFDIVGNWVVPSPPSLPGIDYIMPGVLDGMHDDNPDGETVTEPAAPPSGLPGDPIPMAEGGAFLVNRPTHFIAGEAGAEIATFRPVRSSLGTKGNVTVEAHLYGYMEEQADQLIRIIKERI